MRGRLTGVKSDLEATLPEKTGVIQKTFVNIKKYKYLYLLLLPGFIWYLIYKYLPMYGLIIAFKDYNFSKGIFGSPWVGLKHFKFLFSYPDFYRILIYTILLYVFELFFVFLAYFILWFFFDDIFLLYL